MSDRDPSERNPADAGRPGGPTEDAAPRNETPADITGGEVRTEEIAPEATAGGANMGEARLGGVDGIGTLQVVRDRNAHVLHVEGTWRPHDESVDVSALDESVSAGRPIRYEGKLHDPSEPKRDRCDLEVAITSRSEYTYDARKEDDGRTLPMFNFRPADEGDEPAR